MLDEPRKLIGKPGGFLHVVESSAQYEAESSLLLASDFLCNVGSVDFCGPPGFRVVRNGFRPSTAQFNHETHVSGD